MSTRGQRAVRDALRSKQEDLEQAFFAQATVTAVSALTVTVRFPGATVGQSWPRLNPTLGVDVGDVVLMGGQPGAWACLGTLTDLRDVAARAVRATGNINSDGAIGAVGNVVSDTGGFLGRYVKTSGDITADGATVIGATVRSTGNVNADGAVGAGGNLVAGNLVGDKFGWIRTSSERRLKDQRGDLEPVIDRLRAGRWTWKPEAQVPARTANLDDLDPDAEVELDTDEHVSIFVDELADADPAAVLTMPDGTRTPDDRAVIAHLVVYVQRLQARIAALEASAVGQRTGSTEIADQPVYDENTGIPPSPEV